MTVTFDILNLFYSLCMFAMLIAVIYLFNKNRKLTKQFKKEQDTTPTLIQTFQEAILTDKNVSTKKKKAKNLEKKSLEPQIDKLILGDETTPIIQIKRGAILNKNELVKLNSNNEIMNRLSPILAQIPQLLNNVSILNSQLVNLSFSPEIQNAIQSGSLEWMKASGGGFRAMATDGKIIKSHGTITSINGLKTAQIGLIVWQTMAIITAQKYLADINQKLKDIKDQISSIEKLLKN